MSSPTRRSVPLPRSGMLPRIGKIRGGKMARTSAGKFFPKATEYFVVVEDESGITKPEAVAAFTSVYPGEPRTLHCMLLGRSPEDNMEGAYRLYGTGKLKRKCDGAECDERLPAGGWTTKPCVCAGLPEGSSDRCKLSYTLQVVLPEVPGVGIWQLETGSVIGSRNMSDWLTMMFDLTGDLRGLRFDLDFNPVKVAPDGTTKTVWVWHPRVTTVTPMQALAGAMHERPVIDAIAAELPALPPPAADEVQDDTLNATGDDEQPLEQRAKAAFLGLPSGKQSALKRLSGAGSVNKLVEEYGEFAATPVDLIAKLDYLVLHDWERRGPDQWEHPSAAGVVIVFEDALAGQGKQDALAAEFGHGITNNFEDQGALVPPATGGSSGYER